MRRRVTKAIRDLKDHLERSGLTLSPSAEKVFQETEALADSVDAPVQPWTFVAVLLAEMKSLRSLMAKEGLDPTAARSVAMRVVRQLAVSEGNYDDQEAYSSRGDRVFDCRTRVVDLAVMAAQRRSGTEVSDNDILGALLCEYDEDSQYIGEVADERLRTSVRTLGHVVGEYDPSLSIRFPTLRRALGLEELGGPHAAQIEHVPPESRPAVSAFLADHPTYWRNCFLIMPFATTPVHRRIVTTVRGALEKLGFNVLRADDKVYSEDLLRNVEAYIFGCRFAVAVFERVLSNEYNPNVSLEVGYFLAFGKPICLLKERTLSRLPSDLVGRLYVEFDAQDLANTVPIALNRWLRDREIMSGPSNIRLHPTPRSGVS